MNAVAVTAQNAQTIPDDLELTIVMPCLNESEAIVGCVEEAKNAIQAAGVPGEVLIVDNGSTDGSQQLARDAGARVVEESKRGYGNAYLRGFKEAKGKYLIMADSDGTYDFSLVPEFLEKLREGNDFVNGSRLKGKMDRGAIPFLHRYVGVPALTWLLNFLSGARFSDAHCGMRGFTREAVEKMALTSPGMEFASEMIFRAARVNLKTDELPINYRSRKGESKLSTFSDGWRHIRFMLLWSPNHLFFMPGAAMLSVGMAMLLTLVWGNLEVFGQTFGLHYMVIGAILGILGYQVASLGIYGRVYGLSIGLLYKDSLVERVAKKMSLEKGLLIGVFIGSIGLAILLGIVWAWIQLDYSFASFEALRPSLLGLTLVVIGAQTFFSAFFVSLLNVRIDNINRN